VTWSWLPSTYDTVAAKYEQRFIDELAGKPRDRELLLDLAASTIDPIVEIGCGPGQVGAFVRAAGHTVVGIDLSTEMARHARARLDGALVGDMRALPLAPGSVGGLVAFYSLIHLRRHEVAGALAEFHRALRPGGSLLVSVHEGEGEVYLDEFIGEPVPIAATMFSRDELANLVSDAGFQVTIAESRPPYDTEGPTTRIYVGGTNVAGSSHG